MLEDFFLKNNTLSSSYEHTVSFVYIKGPVCEKKLKIEEKANDCFETAYL